MGYCTIQEIDKILAQSLTSATSPTTGSTIRRNLLNIGAVRDKNVIPDSIVNQYIQWAGQEIDATLSQMYQTPVCELSDFETELATDIDEYNSYIVLCVDCPLAVGDQVIIIENGVEERHEIAEAIGDGIFATVDPIQFAFSFGARLLRIKFPDPLPWICARLAAANVYDKYFSAEVSPGVSKYGTYLRDQARQKLNDVLNGRDILWGVRRVGRRLYDPTLVEDYMLPRLTEGEKNIDKLSQ